MLLQMVAGCLALGTLRAVSWKCFNSLVTARGRAGTGCLQAGSQRVAVCFQPWVPSPDGVTGRLQQMMGLTPGALCFLSVKWRLGLLHLLLFATSPLSGARSLAGFF